MKNKNKRQNAETRKIEGLLADHFADTPTTIPPMAYRYNPASIRVRVVSDRFRGKSRSEREDMVLPIIRQLPENTQQDITILLLLAPEELDTSMMNTEFDNPSRSLL